MKKFALIVIAAAAMAATPALAQDAGWYAGGGYTHYDLEDANVGGVTGRLGYRFGPNFAAEGEATLGVQDDDNAELDNAFGAYAVGIAPLSPSFELFGRVGYQQLSIDGSGPVSDVDGSGLGYGAGVNVRLGAGLGIRGEYTRLDTDDDEVDAISIAGVVNF